MPLLNDAWIAFLAASITTLAVMGFAFVTARTLSRLAPILQGRSPFDRQLATGRLKIAGKRYRISEYDAHVASLLAEAAELWRANQLRQWRQATGHQAADTTAGGGNGPVLLGLRATIRDAIDRQPLPALLWCATDHRDELRRLGICLLGRCRCQAELRAIMANLRHVNPRLRRDVARALRRRRAWSEMREMLAIDRDPQVQRILTPRVSAAFADRLANFTAADVTRSTSERRPMGLLWPTDLGEPMPPRPASYFRRILLRMQAVLHAKPLGNNSRNFRLFGG